MTQPHSLEPFFNPRSIAVIGASQGKSAFANYVLSNLRNYGFKGCVNAVNPRYEEIDGVPCHPSLSAIEDRPDLCVIAVRAELVPELLKEVIALRIPAATIVSSGFGERDDPKSQDLQRQIDALIAAGDTRLLGPNGMGVAAFDSGAVSIASANIPTGLPKGSLAVVSQSGSTGVSMAINAGWQGVGLSKLITLGNEADVGIAEAIGYLAEDSGTTVILAYIEAIRSFEALRSAFAACQANGKFIIVLKGGTTTEGGKAAQSHTGALAGNGAVWRGVAEGLGIISASSLEHAVQLAQLFTRFGTAIGSRFGAVSAGGGLGVLLTDMLVGFEIEAPAFAPQTVTAIEEGLPDVTAHNPLDLGATFLSGDGSGLSHAMSAIDVDPAVDNLLVAIVPMLDARAHAYSSAVLRGLENVTKPVIVLSHDPRIESPAHVLFRNAHCPVLYPPELAVSALRSWVDYKVNQRRVATTDAPLMTAEQEAVGSRLQQAIAGGRCNVLEDEGKEWLRTWGVPCAAEAVATDEDGAAEIARRLGYPVALKILSSQLLHRGVGNGVLLSLSDELAVRTAYRELLRLASTLPDARILVQRMADKGHEFLIGAIRDPVVGLTLVINKGGDDAERQEDALFELLPVDGERLRERLSRWRPILNITGHNDSVDLEALSDAATRLGNFLVAHGDHVDEMDINPVIVGRKDQGATIVDALLILRPDQPIESVKDRIACQ